MKIDMGESLGASWLKHVKKCLITQTNWRAAKGWARHNVEEIRSLILDAKKYFAEAGYNVISDYDLKTTNFTAKILNACECDVVGVSFDAGIPTFHTFESAFHRGGLGYGNAQENAETVASKLFISALSLIMWFGARRGDLVFATPLARPAVEDKLLEVLVLLDNFFASHKGFTFNFEILANDDYIKYVLAPVLELNDDDVTDDELFLRGMILARMSAKNEDKKNVALKRRNMDSEIKVRKGSIERLKKALKIDDNGLNSIMADEKELYMKLMALKGSPEDPKGWLQYTLRMLYCQKNGLRRITLLDLSKKYGK